MSVKDILKTKGHEVYAVSEGVKLREAIGVLNEKNKRGIMHLFASRCSGANKGRRDKAKSGGRY